MTALPMRLMVKSAPADRRAVAKILPVGNAPDGFEIVEIPYGDARLTDGFLADPTAYYLTAGAGFVIVRLDAADRASAFRGAAAAALEAEIRLIRPAVGALIGGQPAVTQRHIYAWLHGRISAVKNILADNSKSDAFRGRGNRIDHGRADRDRAAERHASGRAAGAAGPSADLCQRIAAGRAAVSGCARPPHRVRRERPVRRGRGRHRGALRCAELDDRQ